MQVSVFKALFFAVWNAAGAATAACSAPALLRNRQHVGNSAAAVAHGDAHHIPHTTTPPAHAASGGVFEQRKIKTAPLTMAPPNGNMKR